MAIGVNVTKFGKPHLKKYHKKQYLDKTAHKLSQVKCYNYQKIDYYGNNCLELKN